SRLAMRGAPAKAIQELAGHENLTTMMRYMHLSRARAHEPHGAPQPPACGQRSRRRGPELWRDGGDGGLLSRNPPVFPANSGGAAGNRTPTEGGVIALLFQHF